VLPCAPDGDVANSHVEWVSGERVPEWPTCAAISTTPAVI
jgi:hypothetical protein